MRWCHSAEASPLPIVLCDECEAYWMSPDVTQPHGFLDPESGRVGGSGWYAWGSHSRWAVSDEVTELGWDRPSGPITTEWVLPVTDSALSEAISFFGDTSSITIMGPDFGAYPDVTGSIAKEKPPPSDTDS